MEGAADVTRMLRDWSQGNPEALSRLVTLLYNELKSLARRHLNAEAPGSLLQTTALVHEVYLRLVGQHHVDLESRNQFFALASRIIRRILTDQARERLAAKRGGGAPTCSLDDCHPALVPDSDMIALDMALERLAAVDERKGRVVDLKFFAGFSALETARVLGVSEATVERDWNMAKAWLLREMRGSSDAGSAGPE
jgi:RNA polymerase sigma factor (TIGR02999 family)